MMMMEKGQKAQRMLSIIIGAERCAVAFHRITSASVEHLSDGPLSTSISPCRLAWLSAKAHPCDRLSRCSTPEIGLTRAQH